MRTVIWLAAALAILGLGGGLLAVTSPDWRIADKIADCDRIAFSEGFPSGTATVTVTGAECREVMHRLGFTWFQHWSRMTIMADARRHARFYAKDKELLCLGMFDNGTCQQTDFPQWGDLCLSARGRDMIERYRRALAAIEPSLIADRRTFSGAWSSADGLHLQLDVDKVALTMRSSRHPGVLEPLQMNICTLNGGVGSGLLMACVVPIPGVGLFRPFIYLKRAPGGLRMEFTYWYTVDPRLEAAVLPCFAEPVVRSGDRKVITVVLHAETPQ